MSELAEIFQQYGPAYRAKYGARMLPSHQVVMAAIEQCRTESLGGHLYYCEQCDQSQYSYHSCRNRHCPKCQQQATEQWLARQQALLLPVPHFLVTFTLPDGLRKVARSHQQEVYNLLFRTSAEALQQLAHDPRFVGGQIGMVGVLHTWGRDMSYHPHVHYLVPGGGLAPDGTGWRSARTGFLVPVKALSKLFRAKFRDALKKTTLFELVPAAVWRQAWVVHSKAVDRGQATLKYLAPYVFRVAISNKRIVKVQDDQVTFRYQPSGSKKDQYCTLSAEEFIRRFLQHVLPKGFVKIRYYGYFSPGQRPRLKQARALLEAQKPGPQQPEAETSSLEPEAEPGQPPTIVCPKCGQVMQWQQKIQPQGQHPP
jgi:hypothetical protein